MNTPSSTQRLRILFLAPFAPRMQAGHGGARVIAQLITHLGQKHAVGLCYLRSLNEPPVDQSLREMCEVVEEVTIPEVKFPPAKRWSHRSNIWKQLIAGKPLWAIDRFSLTYETTLKRMLQTWQPDIVQCEFHVMGQYLPALAEYPAPRILVQHEPGAETTRERMRSGLGEGRIISQFDLLAWKRYEREIIQQVQAVVVFTERDRKAVSKLAAQAPIVKIPFGTEIPEYASNPVVNDHFNLLFVGNFKHLPNVDAANRLIHGIFPRVQAQFPNAHLSIVGDHLPTSLLREANENIILTGYVPDLAPYIEKATLVVVPLRLGGGMRVKVLEALAAGKTVIASSRAVEGLDLVDGEQVILAEEDLEFAQAITDLLRNQEKRLRLAAQARAWAQANLSWDRVVAVYEVLYQCLLRC